MKKRLSAFRLAYLIYAGVLIALVIAALSYVGSLLREYERSQPEAHVQQALEQFLADADAGKDLQSIYGVYLPESGAPLSQYEAGTDLQQAHLDLLADDELKFAAQTGTAEDELLYHVEKNGLCLAQVALKANGPTYTKLAVFSMRDWSVVSFTPVLEAKDYTLTVPSSFDVKVNGIDAEGTEKDRLTEYALSGMYLTPELTITDEHGTPAEYKIKKNKISVEYYDYSLTLPSSLTVTVNGAAASGEDAGSELVQYSITSLTKPTVDISDLFGNTITYEGGELPLTYATVTADERCVIQVAGKAVPDAAVTTTENPEFETFKEFVSNLPGVSTYRIAILQKDAEISATDPNGKAVELEQGKSFYDLTLAGALETVPEEVSAQVDVLKIAQNWSLFLTRDYSFSQLKKYIVPNSYQYEVAYKYANSIDYTFISSHTLFDPPFVDNLVKNFVWITDDCFSVDISFVKRMNVARVGAVDDPMNDRFYFVKYDSTNDGVDNPVWLLASMKEIVNE